MNCHIPVCVRHIRNNGGFNYIQEVLSILIDEIIFYKNDVIYIILYQSFSTYYKPRLILRYGESMFGASTCF